MTVRIEALMPSPAPGRIEELTSLVHKIVDNLDAGRNCDALIAQIDVEAGSPGYSRSTFIELHSWTSAREFAERAAMGRPPAISDLTLQEIAACVRIIEAGEEPQSTFYLGVLESSFPYIPVCDMIFCSRGELPTVGLAAEIFRRGRESGPILL